MNSTQGDFYRPLYHFAPATNWMNDPNGLVYYEGEYHLYYQHNPYSTVWGPMHWGHAVSRDLVNWQHLPVALYPDENGLIFSGSAVIDWQNTAGFGKEAMLALFTHFAPWLEHQNQSQSLAISTDRGRTWTKYPSNPLLHAPPDTPDFRDPNVFWYEDTTQSHWVMCLAAGHAVLFYTSPDLIHWSPSGSFGPDWGAQGKVWETPDLFRLPVDAGSQARWVLMVSIGDGGPAGGSATQYFIGDFNGQTFCSENPPGEVLWADYGADFYAPQSWNNVPEGRRLLTGWLSNWMYATVTPTEAWRGMFCLPRQMTLTQTPGGIRLVQQPIPELHKLRRTHHSWRNLTLSPQSAWMPGVSGEALEILIEMQPAPGVERFGLRARLGNGEFTSIGYQADGQRVFIDRSEAGQSAFYPGFAACHSAPLELESGCLRLHVFIDRFSVEVFANHGLVCLTDSIFPSPSSQGLEFFAGGSQVTLSTLDIWQLEPASFTHGL